MADRYKEHVRQLVMPDTRTMSGIVLAAINAKWIHPSLALRLLKANLGALEERCEILEFALRQPLREKVEPILAARPRILGLSVSIWNHTATLELLKVLEEKWRDEPALSRGIARASGHSPEPEFPRKPVIVLGGPEVSRLPGEAEIFRYADHIIRGEGEESFRELCEVLLKNPKSGFAPEKFIEGKKADLASVVPAYRLYTDEDVTRKLVYVEASRGCPFNCEFCQGPAGRPGETEKVREFPLAPFLADMGNLMDRGGRIFKFLDRTFNLNIDRAIRIMEFFLERIEKRGGGNTPAAGSVPTAKETPFCVHFEMVPFRFPPALRETLRRFPPAGLRLELGIQTLNSETAALIHVHRPGGADKTSNGVCGDGSASTGREPPAELEALEFLRRETNAIVHADLIAGLPGEGFDSFGEGFDKLWRVLSGGSGSGAAPGGGTSGSENLFEIQLGILKCLPGTPIIRHNETHGMKYSPEPPYEVTETAALSAAELARIKNFARFWEIIVNRNPFPALIPRLLPPGERAFQKFMSLSDRLFARFGRNWGIDRNDLRLYLENLP